MIYDIRQFRFGDSDVTKIRLSAVSNANICYLFIYFVYSSFDSSHSLWLDGYFN